MASPVKFLLLSLTVFVVLRHFSVSPFEYEVGNAQGWVVPQANGSKLYNDWASENRFRVGDTVRFKYRKDSVMEVEEGDYKNCNSTHPIFFANTGDTVVKLDHAGSFYFISGASGHCHKGQRVVIKVLAADHYSPSTHQSTSSASSVSAFGAFGSHHLVTVWFALWCLGLSSIY